MATGMSIERKLRGDGNVISNEVSDLCCGKFPRFAPDGGTRQRDSLDRLRSEAAEKVFDLPSQNVPLRGAADPREQQANSAELFRGCFV